MTASAHAFAGVGAATGLSLRHPDTTRRDVMTRRGWWLVVLNFVIPGSAQALAGNRRLGKIGLGATLLFWMLLIVALVSAVWWRPALLAVLTQPIGLLLIEVLIAAFGILWVVLAIDTLRLVRLVRVRPGARVGLTVLSVALLVISGGGAVYAGRMTDAARGALGSIFGVFGNAQGPSDGYYNILLLGADSGKGRDGMRFDSISVASINATTGKMVLTGIPRDLKGFPFSKGSPMRKFYPDVHEGHTDPVCGWSGAINQLNTELELCRPGNKIYPDAVKQNSTPGVEATRDGAEGLLGISIQYYAFIDMAGFAALVDALGGVEVTVTERLPEGGGPKYEGEPVDQWATGWIEPGRQRMNGETAQWYARSRKTTSDWDRMQRQRQLQQAILAQFTPTVVISRFDKIAAAGQHLLKTDIPSSTLGTLADLALKAKGEKVTTVELTPAAGVDQTTPDIALVHRLVRDALHPASATKG